MRRWLPYAVGMWLTEVFGQRCVLCRTYPRAVLASEQLATNKQIAVNNQVATTDADSLAPVTAANHLTTNASFSKRPFSKRPLLCQYCHQAICWQPPGFSMDLDAGASLSIQSASYYDYPVRAAITAFKHRQDMTQLPFLIHVLRQLPRPRGCHANNSVILPMPTTPQRLANRGFDPVTILSHYLAQHWQIPLWHGVLRVDNAISQQGLSRAERLSNLQDAFELRSTPPTPRILLFDDVATTGASLKALALSVGNASAFDAHYPSHIAAYALAHGNNSA